MEQNPHQIQPGPMDDPANPMVLFHDAGGTIYPYFRLADLQRPLYGMGVVYAHLVKSIIPSGNIILGGWSLGGSLAMEVASRLMQLPQYTVQGVILIDSVFLSKAVKARAPTNLDEFIAGFKFPPQMPEIVSVQAKQCVLHSYEAQRGWKPPPLSSRPHAVLLRATERINPDTMDVHFLDCARDSNYLGWEECDPSFIVACLDVPGNHFTLFDSPNNEIITRQIQHAISILTERQR
ncbi:hypothetical protein N7499_008066 [Penicillium canescens]|uniref:uncharacterized protein n=1 Tax=Penicillium canescens TaxID=5083 RepID=UPI0026E01BD3|nr:uncharacterized protein N7446_013101 [Penicillium canescens]KAJ5985646.1 hypothetical protein N7522_012842 [Penicillium canescens]KAJ6025987.1 hypothetical protein N7444_013666 [Penicillium canescens]KAJ6042035.1 hypothetical protein N7446_013101 [Penicillium canescens]KAJ6076085.1 hypothetical protein N7499_008066 [Penicillium canescens]KAJ6158397.1 hypothetical protein N7485_011223 [Penicillium canescens]